MPQASVTSACASLQTFIKQKCSKLNLPLSPDLPPYTPAPSTPSSAHPSHHSPPPATTQPSREVLALTYDVLYAVMEEVMLVDAKVKSSVDQASSYMRKLSQVWKGTRDVTAFLDGDACQFWVTSFPAGVLAVPWMDMETKLQAWAHSQGRNLGVLWPSLPSSSSSSTLLTSTDLSPFSSFSSSSSHSKTSAARALQLRLEGCATGYVSVQGLALFVYKSTLIDSLSNFCAEDVWTAPTKDVIVTIGYPKDTETSLRQYGFVVHNIVDWIDFKMWLYAQKEIRAMMKSEPNVVEFIVNNSMHPCTTTLGEEVVRFLRARRILSPVTIVGISNSQILHNYDSLYLATNLDNVWALNRYHRREFKNLAESSAKFLKQAPRHHRTDLVDTFPYKNVNLPALPPITCHLEWMRILILEDNALEHLPVSIGNLTCLFRLTLTSNKLQYIPASIALLTQLRELYINKNNFTNFPAHVCKLVELKVLNLANNPLTAVPPTVAHMTGLLDLDVRSTTLCEFPSSMGDMIGLQQFTLDKENFQSYPKSFCDGYTYDKIKFLKELQPGSRTGLQQIILLGKDGSNVVKNMGSALRKILPGAYEVDMKNARQESITFVVWDFSGKDISVEMAFFSPNAIYIIVENDPQNQTITRFRSAVQSVIKEKVKFIAVYTFSASQDDAEEIASGSGCFRALFLGNEDYKKEFQEIVPNIHDIDCPQIEKSLYMFSKFLQEQTRMFMSWKEAESHIKHYTTDPNALKFLVKYGYIFFHGDAVNYQPSSDNAMLVLPPALNLVPQIKASLKGFEKISRPDLEARLTRICGDSVDFQLIINLLKNYSVLHSIDEETFFLVPFIHPYVPGYPFAEGSDNPVNLVRVYTSEEDCFSLEWFLNVITGIHSTCQGQVRLVSIDSHTALITIDIPDPPLLTFSPPTSPDLPSPATPATKAMDIPGKSTAKTPDTSLKSSDPQITNFPEAKSPRQSTPSRFSNFLSFQRNPSFTAPKVPPTPPPTTSPSPSTTSPSPTSPPQSPLQKPATPPPVPTVQLKCYLHRSPSKNDHKFWFVLSCPSLNANSQNTFTTILQNIQWLLNHWIDNPSYTFDTCCYTCFDMAGFVKSKTASCPISQSDCIRAIRELSMPECQKCNQHVDISSLVPDLSLPLHLTKRIDAKELTEDTKLARGGYGDIYKSSMDGKEVVIKTSIRDQEDETEKFMREMVLTSNLQHPNVISCVGLSRTPTLALLLEFAPLGSLNSVISQPSLHALPRPLISRIALEIARGMRFLHERGVVFQDLKSLNILVMSLEVNSQEPIIKLTDFGTAEYHMGFSAKYQRYCTSTYKTPETFSPNPVDMVLSDIYCYGLILWELLARKSVESHLKEQDEANKKANKKEVLPKDRHLLFSATTLPPPLFSSPLASILTACLQEFPKRRPQSFSEIEELIKKIKD